jgi:hypothetical protein
MALARSKTTKLVDAPIPGDIGSERTGANSVDPGRSREEIGLPKCTRRRIQAIVSPLAVGLPRPGQEGFPFGRTQGGCIADLGYAKSADVDLFAGKNIGRLLCFEGAGEQPKPSTPCEQTNFSGEEGLCNHGAKVS